MRRFKIAGRSVGFNDKPYVIAELSANHLGDLDRARKLVRLAAASGADAIKLQTYTAETIAAPGNHKPAGTPWSDQTLRELYEQAQTPWDWHPELFGLAHSLGLHAFSTPFDETAVDFLETLDVPALKIASAEMIDHRLLRRAARSGKPLLVSTGMATIGEMTEAVDVLRKAGCADFALLKCTATYPAVVGDANLAAIPHMAELFGVHVGLSDHSLGEVVPIAAVAVGARIIEKHLTISRADGGPDAAFSLEPNEFARMVYSVRATARALGSGDIRYANSEIPMRRLRRSLYAAVPIAAGQHFTSENVVSRRPALGWPADHLGALIGHTAGRDIKAGEPIYTEAIGSAL